MNLREQLERATGSVEVAHRETGARTALRVLAVLAVSLLATLTLGPAGAARPWSELGGAFAVNLLLVGGMAAALRLLRPDLVASTTAYALLAAVIAVVVALAGAATRLRPGAAELVPIAFMGIVLSAIFDRRLGLAAVLFTAALLAVQPAFRAAAALPVLLAAGGAATFIVRPTSERDQSYVWMIAIAAATTLALAASGAASGGSLDTVRMQAIRAVGISVVCVIGAMVLMPWAESLTGRETHRTLLEWADLNRPLLQRLSLEAPGTYAHTIAIANLAEAAARVIGANPLLTRVGAYYHDIGKLAKPHYFVENQARGRNPHDKLKPMTSASIIRNHIREGLELAEAERVPKSIRAFITEHHGTNTIAFFLERAREREGGVANPAEFTYPGPVPQSAETAVVMLADGVEAASRALAEPTPERIREVIESVVRQRLEQGQLRDAPLTMRQLTQIKREFARVLGGMYHGRVDYPTPPVPAEAVS